MAFWSILFSSISTTTRIPQRTLRYIISVQIVPDPRQIAVQYCQEAALKVGVCNRRVSRSLRVVCCAHQPPHPHRHWCLATVAAKILSWKLIEGPEELAM